MADSEAGKGTTQGFWGSIEAGGTAVMVNLRLVRHARPVAEGTELVFGPEDRLVVRAAFDLVSQRLYAAYDADAAKPDKKDGEDKDNKEEGSDDASDDKGDDQHG